MKAALAASALTLLMLPGCVSLSRSHVDQAMAKDLRTQGRVTQVRLTSGPSDVSGEFRQVFETRVADKLRGCADGDRPLRLEADVTVVDKANPLVTVVLADANRVRGDVVLYDVATNRPVGRYRIGRTIVGSRFGLLQMAEAEEQLSDAFGKEVCDKVFNQPG